MARDLTEQILDRAHNAAISLDDRGLVTYWNPSAEQMFGVSRQQALGRTIAELVIPERFRAEHVAGMRRFLEEGVGPVLDRRIELAALRADGSEFPVEMTISALEEDSGWSFHAFVQDISERRRGEQERELLVEELRRALSGSERRFDAIVGSLSDPVTIRTQKEGIVYANRAALAHLGYESWEQLRATSAEAIMDEYIVRGEDGGEISMEDIPSVRILAGESSAEPLLIHTVHRESGVQRWNQLKAAPLLDESGATEATIMIIEDVTEQRRSQLQSVFLAQASSALASSLDYEQTLRNVAQLAVPAVVDWCAVDLLDPDGDRHTVAIAHVDPERLELAEELRRYLPERLDRSEGLGLVLESGEPLHYPRIPDEMLRLAAADEAHLDLLRAVGMRSVLIVPMRLGDRVLGAMTLVSAESARVLDERDLELAEQIAGRAAVAIENSRLYSERSRIARTLQQSLLPDRLPEIPGYELASIYLPAVETSMVGGDFYDVWQVGEAWMVIVGDVTGKGIDAAALTALVRHTVQAASEFERSPAALLAFVDSALKRRPALSVCTALCMRVEGSEVTLAVGGHPLPLQVGEEGVRELGEHGPLLGAFADVSWRECTLTLESATTLIAYTDGVTDAQGEGGERFGLPRLHETLQGLQGETAAGLLERLSARIGDFQRGALSDDTAALALRRLPGEEHPAGRQETIGLKRTGTSADE